MGRGLVYQGTVTGVGFLLATAITSFLVPAYESFGLAAAIFGGSLLTEKLRPVLRRQTARLARRVTDQRS